MPLQEHPLPAVVIIGDVADVPALLAASLPVDPVSDQTGCDVQLQRGGQFLLQEVPLGGQQLSVNGPLCDTNA